MKKLKKVVKLINKTVEKQRNRMRIAKEKRVEIALSKQRVVVASLEKEIEAAETDLKPLVHNLEVISNKYKFADISKDNYENRKNELLIEIKQEMTEIEDLKKKLKLAKNEQKRIEEVQNKKPTGNNRATNTAHQQEQERFVILIIFIAVSVFLILYILNIFITEPQTSVNSTPPTQQIQINTKEDGGTTSTTNQQEQEESSTLVIDEGSAKVCVMKTVAEILQERSYEKIYAGDVYVRMTSEKNGKWVIEGSSQYWHAPIESVIDNLKVDNTNKTTKVLFSCMVEASEVSTCATTCGVDGIVDTSAKRLQEVKKEEITSINVNGTEYNLAELIKTCTVVKETWANPNGNLICNAFRKQHPNLYP